VRLRASLAIAVALLAVGCLRVGPGDDLHLVCEDRTASPRKAYDIGFLVAQTRVEGQPPPDRDKVAMLEAARHHVITPGGRPHGGFRATLAPAELPDAPEAWLFEATGVGAEGAPPDAYRVVLWKEGATWVGGAEHRQPNLVRPPHSIAQPAWDAVNASAEARAALPEGSREDGASWSAALPSCVRLAYRDAENDRTDVVVNVVQSRVVFIDRTP